MYIIKSIISKYYITYERIKLKKFFKNRLFGKIMEKIRYKIVFSIDSLDFNAKNKSVKRYYFISIASKNE